MKKYIVSILVASLFLIGTPFVAQKAFAAEMSIRDFISLLVIIGVIPQDKIPAVNAYLATLDNNQATNSSNSVSNWKTYTNTQYGFSFQYPVLFEGADLQGGLPQVFVTSTSTGIDITNGCYKAVSGARGYAGGSLVTLNGIQFCLSLSSDAGMSQLYRSYFYTTHRNGKYITIGYTSHTSNGCGVFLQGTPDYTSCEYYRENYSNLVIKPIQDSVATLKFIN